MPHYDAATIAVQLYSLREQLAADRRAALEAVAAIGYRAVEPYDVLTDPAGFKEIADELGLKVCSAHARAVGDNQKEVFDGALALGADTVIVPFEDPATFESREKLAAFAEGLNAAAAAGAARGLRVGYHNHAFELTNTIDGKTALEVLAELTDDSVLLEVDTYWAQVGGQDVPALLRRLGDRVRFLHIKDGQVDPAAPMLPVGKGVMPVHDIIAAGESVEYRIVELDECATDMVDAVRESFEYLTGSSK